MDPAAPSTSFPGNIVFYVLLVGFVAFFAWSAFVRVRFITDAKGVNRFTDPIRRMLDLVPWLLGNLRVARPTYWYSGLLHTLIWWGFIVLQVRTLNFLLNGIHHDISLEKNLGDVWDYLLRPTMDIFNILVIIGVAMAAFQRFVWRPKRLTLNMDAWIILGLLVFLMVSDVFVNSFEIYLFEQDNEKLSFLAYGLSEFWEGPEHVPGHGRGAAHHLLVHPPPRLPDVPLLSSLLQALARPYDHPAGVHAQSRADRRPSAARRLREARAFRRRQAAGLHVEANARFLLVHRVRAVYRRLPRQPHRKVLSPKQVIVDIRHLMEEQEPAVSALDRKKHGRRRAPPG